jgi:hypothetical protein
MLGGSRLHKPALKVKANKKGPAVQPQGLSLFISGPSMHKLFLD